MATDTQKMTKADLREALDLAETNIAASVATINALTDEVAVRNERIVQLQQQSFDNFQRADRLEDDLRHHVAWATQVGADIELEREAASLIDAALAIDVESMFSHLHFAVATMASIVAYGGDSADVCRNMALVAGQEMIDLVEDAVVSGRFTANGALAAAVAGAYESMSEGDEGAHSSETATECCGGTCGGGC